ncbi:hypothetical protein CRE_18228 [Caenorhabditis remanei]|uniref:Uncharacterized protein n=1 Tax=Caenorhabditis remanei TaxID=31234 RepID=E3NFG9_CAERE|nr:hypothetical protein CRE_18228 [Caenorhabditis remanei]
MNAKTGWATRKISSRPKQAVGGYSLLYIDGNEKSHNQDIG